MAKNEPFDDALASWLQDTAPARIPERVLNATFERTRQTRQHVGWRAFFRRHEMLRSATALSSAALLVLVAAVALSVYVNQQGIGGHPTPTPGSSPSPSPAPSPSATPTVGGGGGPCRVAACGTPALTTTFVSPINGYSFGYFDRGGLTPATEAWDPVTQGVPRGSGANDEAFDTVETGLAAFFLGASTVIPDGVSIDEWVDKYISPGTCGVPRSRQAEITIDGQSARIAECPNEIDATVVAGGRLYLFTLLHDRSDARAVFDSWVATIHLRPQDAATPSATAR